jgi:streptogramin lyase
MMRRFNTASVAVCLLAFSSALAAQEYKLKVVASGLARPTGIAVDDDVLYFTEVPQPGVGGGMNAVKKLDLEDGKIQSLHFGEPEPVNIVVGRDGTIYWICKSAGVILKQDENGVTTAFLTGLHKPSGIAISKKGVVYFTEVPTPGVAGGKNGVFSSADGKSIQTVNMGEPEPVDVAVASNGDVYWTCRTAGVILVRSAKDGMVRLLLSGLKKPTGIAIDSQGRNLYYTEVPTPGVSGAKGGMNRVVKYDLKMKKTTVINTGDPEPTDIAVGSNGDVYWTCSSAGVIVQARLVRHDDDDERGDRDDR